MRILFLSHYFPPEVNAPATRTYEHCRRWAACGHDVTVITCAPNCPDGVLYDGYSNTWRPHVEWIDGVRVVRVWSYLAANTGTVRRILNYLSYMLSATLAAISVQRPDVVIATSPQFFCGWAGVVVSRLKRAPFVLEVRDLWPESIAAVGAIRNRALLRGLEFLERTMYRAARHIVAVGHGYRDRILQKIDAPERVSVITNGVDLEMFQPGDSELEFRPMWDCEGKFVCSYVGTIGMAHGLEVVIEAAQLLKRRGRDDIRFCLIGDGARRERLEAKAEWQDVRDMVVFAGRLPREEVPAVLAGSDACLIPLKQSELFETVLPSKMFEAMAMARPVVLGVKGEARAVMHEAGAGLAMEPEDAESLVDCLERLADSPALAHELGAAGRSFVVERYDRDTLAARYLRLLHKVCELPATEPLPETSGAQLPRPETVTHPEQETAPRSA